MYFLHLNFPQLIFVVGKKRDYSIAGTIKIECMLCHHLTIQTGVEKATVNPTQNILLLTL